MEDRDKPVARVQLEKLEITLHEEIAMLDCKCEREIMTVSHSTSQDLLKLEQRCIENLEAAEVAGYRSGELLESRITTLENEVKALKEERKANRSWWQIW